MSEVIKTVYDINNAYSAFLIFEIVIVLLGLFTESFSSPDKKISEGPSEKSESSDSTFPCGVLLAIAIIIQLAICFGLRTWVDKQPVEYETASIAEIVSESEQNIARARKEYNDEFLELSGTVTGINLPEYSQDAVFLLKEGSNPSVPIQCVDKNRKIKEFNTGDNIVAKGLLKIVETDNAPTYTLLIREIEAAPHR